MANALLAGATGLVGSKLLEELLNRDRYQQVHILVRRPIDVRHPKLVQHQVDFDHLDIAGLGQFSDVFCCLGTTIKQAGSQEAFRKVDFAYVMNLARQSRAAGAAQFVIVTAMGANAGSRIFYNRVKGEVEQSVSGLGFRATLVFRPSFIGGVRQGTRVGEGIALKVLQPLSALIPLRYRVVPARAIARAMFDFAGRGLSGTHIIESDRIQEFG